MAEEKKGNRKYKLTIIVLLLVVALSLGLVLGFFILNNSNKDDWGIATVFKPKEQEHTLLLDEFLVNLKSEGKGRNYLKIQIALMYENEKEGQILETNTNKIRDIIINQLRNKTSEEMLDIDKTLELKKDITNNINVSLRESIVKDIYFTHLVIQ